MLRITSFAVNGRRTSVDPHRRLAPATLPPLPCFALRTEVRRPPSFAAAAERRRVTGRSIPSRRSAANEGHCPASPLSSHAASSRGEEEASTAAVYAGRRGMTATGTITAASYARRNRASSTSPLPVPCMPSTSGEARVAATRDNDVGSELRLRTVATSSGELQLRPIIQREELGGQESAKEDKLNGDNRSVVNGFQAEFEDQLDYLSKTMATSISRQSEHLHCVENCCHSFLDLLEKISIAILVFHEDLDK
nr:kinesin-like protein KIN-5C [Ipomoea batatas]